MKGQSSWALVGFLLGALASPAWALANGGDIHFGGISTGIPVTVAIVGGGILGVFLVTFIGAWAYSYRTLRRGRGQPGTPSARGKGGKDGAG